MSAPTLTRWQIEATDGRRPLGRVFLLMGKAAADKRAQEWVAALGKGWTLVKVECLDTQEAA